MVDNANQIKKLNAAAKKKAHDAHENGKREQEELNKETKQETLFPTN
jgi:hypothetical protein